MSFKELKKHIQNILAERKGTALYLDDLISMLGLPHTDRKRIRRILNEMANEGTIVKLRGKAVAIPSNKTEATGTLSCFGKGFGFLRTDPDCVADNKPVSIFIPQKYMADALNGDRVRVRLLGEVSKRPEGQILEVLKRATATLVGTFVHTRKGGYVTPHDDRITRGVATARPAADMGIENNDYVLVRIDDWTGPSEDLRGTILRRVGSEKTKGIDLTIALLDNGITTDFAPETLEEAQSLPPMLSPEEIAKRLDLRTLTTFTIDGPTAKDFDDALSINVEPDGSWLLGVHIADVSHYVREGSALDDEARDRATSIYPVDRVIPMLPHELSDGICSLRPNEDRAVLSVFMHIDAQGAVHDYSIHNAVIRSTHRLIYEDVQAIMDHTASTELIRSIGSLRDKFEQLYALRRCLTEMRNRRGALDLGIPEVAVMLDDTGEPTELTFIQRLESHRVVEECMLIANEVVAAHLWNRHLPALYRIHEPPDSEKFSALIPILAYLGLKLPAHTALNSHVLQTALDRSKTLPHGFIARRLLLRSMMQARYSDEKLGHFGLASTCYCHFTAPIRRYPDLIVHRIIKESIEAGIPSKGFYTAPGTLPPEQGIARPGALNADREPQLSDFSRARWNALLPELAQHCSERERRAEIVERQAVDIKIMEYMKRYLGEEFNGVISSTLPHGFFVQLDDLPVEGFVPIRNLLDDFYTFDDTRMLFIGKTSGTVIKLGDPVTVAVLAVNATKQEIDFALLEHRISSPSNGTIIKKNHKKNIYGSRKPHYRVKNPYPRHKHKKRW